MPDEIDFAELIMQYKSDPYVFVDVCAVHSGRVSYKVVVGETVSAPGGKWQQVPGSHLYEITRERNPKIISSRTNGTVVNIYSEFDGRFVEAGEKLMTIKHPLTRQEIIDNILKKVLSIFPAPETARYFFTLDIQSRIKKKGARMASIESGEEILTMSLMKRDSSLYYNGESGVIYSIYFKPSISVQQGDPLIGVCTAEKLLMVNKIISRVQSEWDS